MSKVYLVVARETTGRLQAGDAYYAHAVSPNAAEDIVMSAVRQYYFKVKLANKDQVVHPKMLGPDVIVEGDISEDFPNLKHRVTEITDIAYLWKCQGLEHWKDWNITMEDIDA